MLTKKIDKRADLFYEKTRKLYEDKFQPSVYHDIENYYKPLKGFVSKYNAVSDERLHTTIDRLVTENKLSPDSIPALLESCETERSILDGIALYEASHIVRYIFFLEPSATLAQIPAGVTRIVSSFSLFVRDAVKLEKTALIHLGMTLIGGCPYIGYHFYLIPLYVRDKELSKVCFYSALHLSIEVAKKSHDKLKSFIGRVPQLLSRNPPQKDEYLNGGMVKN